jgi:hypothetical protein
MCPLALYLYLIVDETFNTITKEDQKKGGCKVSHFQGLRTIIHNTIHG